MSKTAGFAGKIINWLTEMGYLFEDQEIGEQASGYKIKGKEKILELYIGFTEAQKDLCTIQNPIDFHIKLRQQIGKLSRVDKQKYIDNLRYQILTHSPVGIKMHYDKKGTPTRIEVIGSLYEDGTSKTTLEHMLISVRQAGLSILHYLQFTSHEI